MSEPILDRARLDMVCMGDPALAAELIDLLIEEATPILAALPGQVAARDATTVRQQAHAVKGIAGNVGAGQLQAAALTVERGAADGVPWETIEAALRVLTAALDDVRAERAKMA